MSNHYQLMRFIMKTENEALHFSKDYHEVYSKNSANNDFLHFEKTLNHNTPENNPLHFFGYCLVDNFGKQFTCIHENCQDFCSCVNNELQEEFQDFHPLHFHTEDRLLWCEEVLPDIQRFMYSIPVEELSEYRFCFNHRYSHTDGNISQFLHEGIISFSEDTCLPVLNLIIFTEIGDIKTEDTMVLTIFRYSSDDGCKKVFAKVYGETLNGQLSPREKEIIRLCLEGLSSKMIADKLSLSIHTVKNHKRNSMEKTLTHNIAELISLCIRSRWL